MYRGDFTKQGDDFICVYCIVNKCAYLLGCGRFIMASLRDVKTGSIANTLLALFCAYIVI